MYPSTSYSVYPTYNSFDQVQGASYSEYRNLDHVQAASPYEISSRQKRPLRYGPFYLTHYGRKPLHIGKPRSSGNSESDYLTHMLLANQAGGIHNDHMAQLIYDNSDRPQQVSRYVMQPQFYTSLYDRSTGVVIPEGVTQQAQFYPGFYDRSTGAATYEGKLIH